MNKLLILLIYLSIIITLASCAKSIDQPNCGYSLDQYGKRIVWHSDIIKLYIHTSVPINYVDAIKRSINVWETNAGRKLFDIVGTDFGPLQPRNDGLNVIYYYSSGWQLDHNIQANTRTYNNGDSIYEGDIYINGQDGMFYTDVDTNGIGIHMESLIIHELGHMLGLKHRDAPSVMQPSLSFNTVREVLSAEDVNNLKCGGY